MVAMSVRPLSPELAAKAAKELNEDPKRIPEDLQHIKDWIAKQPHLRARTDDQWLVAFLRGCKYSLERTKEKLDMYYSIRSTAPELFNVQPTESKVTEILELGAFINLPSTVGPDTPRIVLFRPGAYDPDKYTMAEIMCVANTMTKLSIMNDDNAVIAGMETILDLEGVTMKHFLQMTPSTMKKMVVASQDAAPLRMKGTHYLNTPPGFETIFNAIKAMLNEKNRNRLYVHNKDYDAMFKVIPQNILPSEYGGNAGSIKDLIEMQKTDVKNNLQFLLEDCSFGTDETKRPGKPKTAEEMFGVEGSFRKLQLD